MPTIKKLHPTLKACKCGMIGTKEQFYNHLKYWDGVYGRASLTEEQLYTDHGEVPLNEDDPRTKVETQLKESLK